MSRSHPSRQAAGPRPAGSQLFTVRVWQEELGEGDWAWRGQVQHVVSGETRYFQEWRALLDFLMARGQPTSQP